MKSLNVKNLSKKYDTYSGLNMFSCEFTPGSISCIMGESGIGKTTLIKLLLGFYEPVEGNIFIGDKNLNAINPDYWRSICGAVMQEGFIFTDTIRNNIVFLR